jgi:hypothetical protein
VVRQPGLRQSCTAIRRWIVYLTIASSFLAASGTLLGEDQRPAPEPEVKSLYPMGGSAGTSFRAVVRGTRLKGAWALVFEDAALTAHVLSDPKQSTVEEVNPADLLPVEVSVAPAAAVGWHKFRVVTPGGVTNAASVMVVNEPVAAKPDPAHALAHFPVVINGEILKPGGQDSYWVEVAADETLSIEVTSGHRDFDPVLTLLEPSGSWFDSNRLNRIAFNDEPLFFPGLSKDSRLVWRFPRTGKYCIRVSGFAGQGGPDDVYQLRIIRGVAPKPDLHPAIASLWDERQFTRRLGPERLAQLAERGAAQENPAPIKTVAAALEGSGQAPVAPIPALVLGKITKPGEADMVRLRVERKENLVLELETPQATRPRFNPVIRVTDSGGREIVSNVYTRVNNNCLQMMKMIEPKTSFSLNSPGEYAIQIRDITTDYASDDFVYRVLVRHQMPHIGKMQIAPDHINLAPGRGKTITVTIDREEDFTGLVIVSVKGLPTAVTALPAVADPIDEPALQNAGERQRYFAKVQVTTVVLLAAPDAPATHLPANARVEVNIVDAGKPGPPIAVTDFPIAILEKNPL